MDAAVGTAARIVGAGSGGGAVLPGRRVQIVAVAWLLAHLPLLAPALEDIDSINFALGLHDFDPAQHQPHPPGYPVFIALGRTALTLIHLAAPNLSHVHADALALACWSALGGALAIVAAGSLFWQLTGDRERAAAVGFWGAVFLAVTPLFWMTGLRPMSDMLGLGLALTAQALLVRGAADGRALVAGAIVVGLAAGVRTQTVPLTVPLFVYALAAQRHRGVWLVRPVVACAAAALTWAVPLILATGGIDGYIAALGSQAGEDFAWVNMVWSDPSPRTIAYALYYSLIVPFATPVAGAAVIAAAALGGLRMLFLDRRALALLTVAYLPYAVFHLLFQETATLRYAVPLVPPLAYAAAFLACSVEAQVSGPGRRVLVAVPLVVLLLVPNLFVSPRLAGAAGVPIAASYVYGREPHPAMRAIADMEREATRHPPAAVFSHFSLRRPLQAAPTPLPIIEPRRSYEWLGPADYWRGGGTGTIWFLADPGRTDLALIDPQARRPERRTEYVWSVADRPELMGTRPLGVMWYRFDPPGWFAGEGWELTPETTGIARVSNTRLYQRPIAAYVRRRAEPLVAIIAGRDLSPAPGPASVMEVSIDGAVVDRWRIDPSRDGIRFMHVMQLPAGVPAGSGNYATLTIAAHAEQPGVATPQVAVEQFDIQPRGTVMFAFDEGWHEAEYDNRRGLAWRWTGERSTLRILAPGSVVITMSGESPIEYVGEAPTVRFRAGDRELAVFHPDADFRWRVAVPGDVLAAAGGLVTIETDRVYLPGEAEGSADARRLGLRIFETTVR